MYYVISQLLKLNSFANSFMLNSEVIFISLILIYVFNIFIGLLPVVHIIKKTPAQILSRYDLE